ncbi:MAG: hypothetical protein MJ148_03135 [Clostridia bacterium]|nr:hypothetical protein [Clostridia bacterium]
MFRLRRGSLRGTISSFSAARHFTATAGLLPTVSTNNLYFYTTHSLALQHVFITVTSGNLATSADFTQCGKVIHLLFCAHLATSFIFFKSGKVFHLLSCTHLATSFIFFKSGKVFHLLSCTYLATSFIFFKNGKAFHDKSLKSFQKPCHIAGFLNKWQGGLLLLAIKPCHFAAIFNKWQGRLLLLALKPCHFAVFFNKWQGRQLKLVLFYDAI